MTLTKCDQTFLLDVTPEKETYCVYEHFAALEQGKPPELVFVGSCKLKEVLTFNDARRNTEWVRLFGNGGSIMVRIIATGTDEKMCERYLFQYIQAAQKIPRCNAYGTNQRGVARRIKCSDGRVFESQRAAALACGLHESKLSRHMNGAIPHIGGLRFQYIAD